MEMLVRRTSVTMMPANGPRKMVYPFIKSRKPWALYKREVTTPIEGVLDAPRQYFPWAECPPSYKCADDLTPSDINVLTH